MKKPYLDKTLNSLTVLSWVALFTSFTAPFALATTLYWDGGTVDIAGNGNSASVGGTGTWDTTIKNWDAGAVPYVAWNNATNDTAEINGGTQTLTLGVDVTVGRINQKAGGSGATIAEGAGFNSITLGAATTIINVAASVTTGRTLNVNAEVTGANNLSILGPTTTPGGVVNLNRINTFTGTLSIDDTILRIGNGGTAGQLNSGNYSAAISITSTGTFGYSSSLNQTLGGVISGAGNLTKNTAGSTLTLTNSNSYSGTTTINVGKLVGVVGGHHQNSDVTFTAVATTYGVSITDNTKSWTCKSLACAAAGTLEFDFGSVAPSDSVSPLVVTNLAAFTATPLVSVVVSAGLSPGIYPLMTWGSTSGTIPATPQLTVSNVVVGTTPTLSVSGNTLLLVISSTAGSVVKEDNANPLNAGNSWVGGNAPTTTEVAKWNSTVMSPNTTNLGADTTWTGITIENPNGLVTINGINTLTLGAATVDIDMSTATADLNMNCPLALGAANIWNVAASRAFKLGGPVSGAFNITKLGAGMLQLGASNIMPDGIGSGNLSLTGTLDLNGNSDTINGLSGAGTIDNTVAATTTLTVGGNDQTSTFSGLIQDTSGTLNLTKIGTGTLTLASANTLSGAVTISGGALSVNNIAPLANVTGIAMADGTTLRTNVNAAVINAPITLGAVGTMATINASNFDGSGSTLVPFTLGGAISGAGNLTLSGIEATNSYGLIILNAASSYTGSTLITTESAFAGGPPANANIFVRLDVENALPTTTVVTLDGGDGGGGGRFCEVNLNGNNQTLAGLTNDNTRLLRSQEVYNTNATAATLTINNTTPAASTYSGKIGGQVGPSGTAGDNLGLTKSGSGTFTISGANTYTGATTITGGTLALGALNTLPNASAVLIGAGTLNAATSGTETTGTLDVTGAATINVVSGARLVFTSGTATWAGALTITGVFDFSGTATSSLNFGSSSGLTSAQLLAISATGFTNFGLDAEGDLTATAVSGNTFADWLVLNAPATGFVTDTDKDGLPNGVENVLGSNPNTYNAGLTQVSSTANSVTFKHTLNPTIASDVTYGYEWSTNMVEWKTNGQTNTAGTTATIAASAPVSGVVTVTVTITGGPSAKLFGRLVAVK